VAASQKDAAAAQATVDELVKQADDLNKSRATSDAERTKIAAEVGQLQTAQPLVSEALRHLTEAIGKVPTDAELAAVHKQLTEQLNTAEARSKTHQARFAELTTAIDATDAKLHEVNMRLEAGRKELTAVTDRVGGLQTQAANAAKVVETARQAAQPVEAEIAQLQREVARWQDEIAFRDQIAAIQTKVDAATKLAAERQAELDKANERLSAAKATADAAAATLSEANNSVEQLQLEIRTARGIK
jgi:chromosome segregation ATPase